MTGATSDDPAPTERIAGRRQRMGHCSSVLPNREKGAKIISGPGGRRKSLKKLNTDKEIQGKPRYYGADATRPFPQHETR